MTTTGAVPPGVTASGVPGAGGPVVRPGAGGPVVRPGAGGPVVRPGAGGPVLRPDIAMSWRRSQLAGLSPGLPPSAFPVEDVDPRGLLLLAADPVLRRLEDDLHDTGYSFLLADRDCRLVRGWAADGRTGRALEHRNVGVGSVLREGALGTNAVGTAAETGRGVTIHGEEHFVASLKGFSCYAEPIRHPVTRRIEGVLDVTVLGPQAGPVLTAIVRSAVGQIEQRILEGSRTGELALLRAFRSATARRGSAVVALDDEVVLADRAALDLLSPEDYGVLRVVAAGLGDGTSTGLRLTLASGVGVQVSARRVEGTRGGAVVRLRPAPAVRRPAAAPSTAPVLITGPPGSGRSTLLRELVGRRGSVVHGQDAAVQWVLQRELFARAPALGVDDADLLAPQLVRRLTEHAAARRAPRLVIVCGRPEEVPDHVRPLVAVCLERRELLPLDRRPAELPELATRMLRAAGSQARLRPSVVELLAGHDWPGGLHELTAVMKHVADRLTCGDVTVPDLPETHRSPVRGPRLSNLDRAERDTIVRALRDAGGNKRRAAAELCVSRTTLYARMRALRITDV